MTIGHRMGKFISEWKRACILEAFAQYWLTMVRQIHSGKETLSSVVNLTFVGPSLTRDVFWNASEYYTHHDRKAIVFDLEKNSNS